MTDGMVDGRKAGTVGPSPAGSAPAGSAPAGSAPACAKTVNGVTLTERRTRAQAMFKRLRGRPELGSLIAAVVIMVFFTLITDNFMTAAGAPTWLESGSLFGIMAVAVALLMIGGEFDLSSGAIVGSTGLFVGVLTTHYGVPVWWAMLLGLVFALAVGALNGFMVLATKLPSFIVTLGTFFILQGLNLALTKLVIGQVAIQGMREVPGYYNVTWIFGSTVSFGFVETKVSVLWWLGVTALATWLLLRTRQGNWIFAVGGDLNSARQSGVPIFRTKVGLFMTTAGAGWLVGMLSLFQSSTVQASTGVGQEFIYIICAVVGGCVLTGGYGSAVGAALGALIYGMAYQGIVYAGWDNNWLKAVLGVMLLAAVIVNEWVRRRAEAAR